MQQRFIRFLFARPGALLVLGIGLPVLSFLALAEDVWMKEDFAWDRATLELVHGHRSAWADSAMLWFSRLGSVGGIFTLTIAGIGVLLARRRHREAFFLGTVVVVSSTLVQGLKAALQRKRPDLWPSLAPETSFSFPSGHATTSMALVVAVVWLAWSTRLRWGALLIGVPFALLVGTSRVYLGVHYPSDVLAGWALALSCTGAAALAIPRGAPPSRGKRAPGGEPPRRRHSYGPLDEELARTGGWLFRWRSYLPLVPLSLVLLVTITSFHYPDGDHALDRIWELLCFSVSLVGLGVRALTVGFVLRGTSGRNTRHQLANVLNTTGMYSIVRHPLYLGNFLMWLGVALFPRVWWLALLIVLTFWLYYERIMMAEEAFLKRSFGEGYARWAERTPAFIPDLSRWTPPALPFSARAVLKRELSSLLGVVATFSALEVVSDYRAVGRWIVDPLWLAIFVSGLSVYVVLRVLKKSRRLDVHGR